MNYINSFFLIVLLLVYSLFTSLYQNNENIRSNDFIGSENFENRLNVFSFENIIQYDSFTFEKYYNTIIDPIEAKVICNSEFRSQQPLNIIIHNPDIKNELKGIIAGTIVFDTVFYDSINSLKINDFTVNVLRLKDAKTNETIFYCNKPYELDDVNYKIFSFYIEKLYSIVLNLNYWVENENYTYAPSSIGYTFSFIVVPSIINDE
jgi:hypothetical protein